MPLIKPKELQLIPRVHRLLVDRHGHQELRQSHFFAVCTHEASHAAAAIITRSRCRVRIYRKGAKSKPAGETLATGQWDEQDAFISAAGVVWERVGGDPDLAASDHRSALSYLESANRWRRHAAKPEVTEAELYRCAEDFVATWRTHIEWLGLGLYGLISASQSAMGKIAQSAFDEWSCSLIPVEMNNPDLKIAFASRAGSNPRHRGQPLGPTTPRRAEYAEPGGVEHQAIGLAERLSNALADDRLG